MKRLYHTLVPYEQRYWFYKLRHPKGFQELRQKVNPSPMGDFSLRAFDRHACLFIHITKSAGTSVAISLFGELPYHYTAIQYRVIYGRRTFNRYFKFAFVRNPWDRLYSAYTYLKNGGWNDQDRKWYNTNISHIPDFNSFVINWLSPERLYSHVHLWPQSHFICDRKGRPLLNHLGYFETLPGDFAFIAKRLGIESRLGHINASKRVDYRDVYTTEALNKVYELYRRDVENFGYGFNSIDTRMRVRENRLVPA